MEDECKPCEGWMERSEPAARPKRLAKSNAVGAENLCHQVIFMDHASGAVTPLDAEVVQAGDAIGQRAERRGLVQGSVWPVRVVEVLVFAQDCHQVPLVPY